MFMDLEFKCLGVTKISEVITFDSCWLVRQLCEFNESGNRLTDNRFKIATSKDGNL